MNLQEFRPNESNGLQAPVWLRDRSSSASQPLVSSHWEVEVLKRQNTFYRLAALLAHLPITMSEVQ